MLTRAKSFLFGAMVGAAVAFLFDPERGRGRRAKARDMLGARVRRGTRELDRRSRYLEGTLEGLQHRATHPGIAQPEVDDRTLKSRVESFLFARDFPKGDVVIDVVDGEVTLRGQLERPEDIRAAARTVADVPGVKAVSNLLHPPGETPANVVEAQRASRDAERDERRIQRTG
ncbi:MAG TPA: BON domain-containing protein [Actinomycetota bacterium]|nr:BON domain-containing protein [Actinomycetota bacterium]